MITIKSTSRVNILQFLGCIIILALLSKWCHLIALQMLIMTKRVFWSYHSAKENVKYFSEGPFLSHFPYFSYFVTNYISIEYQISITFCYFGYRHIQRRLIPECTHISVIVLVNKFLFFGYVTLLSNISVTSGQISHK